MHVLLLSWHPDFDDMQVKGEVDRLGQVFTDKYRFHVQTSYLENNNNKRTQQQENSTTVQ